MTGGWAQYSWVPAIALTSVTVIFLVDLCAERYVEMKYGIQHQHTSLQDAVTGRTNPEIPHPEEGELSLYRPILKLVN